MADVRLSKFLSYVCRHGAEKEGIQLHEVVVHGTKRRAWHSIKVQGLSRVKRTHIHFATGLPGDSGIISGMRSSSQVLIFINLRLALEDGFKFYRSANDVVLCPGDDDGFLPPKYFSEVRML